MHFHETATPTQKKGRGCGWSEASLVDSGTLPVRDVRAAAMADTAKNRATWLNADDKNAMM